MQPYQLNYYLRLISDYCDPKTKMNLKQVNKYLYNKIILNKDDMMLIKFLNINMKYVNNNDLLESKILELYNDNYYRIMRLEYCYDLIFYIYAYKDEWFGKYKDQYDDLFDKIDDYHDVLYILNFNNKNNEAEYVHKIKFILRDGEEIILFLYSNIVKNIFKNNVSLHKKIYDDNYYNGILDILDKFYDRLVCDIFNDYDIPYEEFHNVELSYEECKNNNDSKYIISKYFHPKTNPNLNVDSILKNIS